MSPWYVREVAGVALDAAGRDERQPQQDDHDRADDRRLQTAPRQPSRARNQAANGTRKRQRLRLRHQRDRERGGGPQGVTAHGEDERDDAEQHVDRLVLAPPRADVDHGGVEQDQRRAGRRPPRRRPEMPRDHARPIARSARLAGVFMIARIAGSADVVTVRNAGSSAARAPQM